MLTAPTLVASVMLGQASGFKLTRVKTLDGIRAVAVASAPTGSRFIASLENCEVRIMDAGGKIPTMTLKGHTQPAYGAVFSPDGKYILTGDEQAKIFLWEVKTGKKIREYPRAKGHQRGIQSLAFNAKGDQFLSVGRDDVICVWNVSGGDPLAKVTGEPANFYGAFFLKNGAVYAGTQVDGWRVLAPKTLATVAKVKLPGGQGANNFAINRNQTLGLTCGRDGTVSIYDLSKRTLLKGMKGHGDFVAAAEFTPSGRYAGTSAIDSTVRIWDVKSYKQVDQLDGRSYVGSPVAFTGDGKYLLTTNVNDTVEIHMLYPPQPVLAPTKRK